MSVRQGVEEPRGREAGRQKRSPVILSADQDRTATARPPVP
jgi:hypothetical protein